jgi:hypothetical protein
MAKLQNTVTSVCLFYVKCVWISTDEMLKQVLEGQDGCCYAMNCGTIERREGGGMYL